MRRLLTGCFVTLLLLLNTLVLIGPLMVFALLKLVLPGRFRDYASWVVMWIAETWSEIDKLIFRLCIPTRWDIRGGDDLRRAASVNEELVGVEGSRRSQRGVDPLRWIRFEHGNGRLIGLERGAHR